MKFTIREVDASDEAYHDDIIELHDLTFFDVAIRPDLPRGWWWLVYTDEFKSPIGFCGLTMAYRSPEIGYLKRAGVLRAYRGLGLQRRLITVRERKARRLGMTSMITDTTDNPPSSNSLIRSGYRIFEPAYRWAFKHSIYWKKDLTK